MALGPKMSSPLGVGPPKFLCVGRSREWGGGSPRSWEPHLGGGARPPWRAWRRRRREGAAHTRRNDAARGRQGPVFHNPDDTSIRKCPPLRGLLTATKLFQEEMILERHACRAPVSVDQQSVMYRAVRGLTGSSMRILDTPSFSDGHLAVRQPRRDAVSGSSCDVSWPISGFLAGTERRLRDVCVIAAHRDEERVPRRHTRGRQRGGGEDEGGDGWLARALNDDSATHTHMYG